MDPRTLGDLLRSVPQYLESPAQQQVYEPRPNPVPTEPPIDVPIRPDTEGWVELRGRMDVSCWYRREYLVGAPKEQVLEWLHLAIANDPDTQGPWLPRVTYYVRELERVDPNAPTPATDSAYWDQERNRIAQQVAEDRARILSQIEEEQFAAHPEVAFHGALSKLTDASRRDDAPTEIRPGPGPDQRLGSERRGEDEAAGAGPGDTRPGDGRADGGGLEAIAELLRGIRDELLAARTRPDEPAGGGLSQLRDPDDQLPADDPGQRGPRDARVAGEDGRGESDGGAVHDRPGAQRLRDRKTGRDKPQHGSDSPTGSTAAAGAKHRDHGRQGTEDKEAQTP